MRCELMDIPKYEEPKGPWWKRVYDSELKRWTARIEDPNGHALLLDHEIADDGTVTPSVECPIEGCGFHENVRLIGWRPSTSP